MALLFFTVMVAFLVLFKFSVLVEIGSLLQSIHTILLMTLVPRLRVIDADRPRPFRMSGGVRGTAFLCALPALAGLSILITVDIWMLVGCLAAVLLCVCASLAFERGLPAWFHYIICSKRQRVPVAAMVARSLPASNDAV